jgi:hypothetical protein
MKVTCLKAEATGKAITAGAPYTPSHAEKHTLGLPYGLGGPITPPRPAINPPPAPPGLSEGARL